MKTIFLDLDGTLIDSSKGLIGSFEYMFNTLGKPIPAKEDLQLYLGPVLKWSLEHLYHMELDLIPKACDIYHERYDSIGVYEYDVFEGVPEMLRELKDTGADIYIATAKGKHSARAEMEKEGLDELFAGMYGAIHERNITRKEQILGVALEEREIDATKAVMVGDRGSDILAGKLHHMTTVAALYGFGSEEELMAKEPDYAVRSVEELKELLLKLVEEK